MPKRIAITAAVTLPALALGAGAFLGPPDFLASDARPSVASGSVAGPPAEPSAAGAEPAAPLVTPASEGPSGAAAGTPTGRATPTRRATTPPRARTDTPPSRRAPRAIPTTAAAPTPRATAASVEEQVVTLVNRERAANGCGPVATQPQLAEAARRHSEDQAAHNNMSHTGSDGSSPWERAERAGYSRAIGENVAAGYRTAEAVMDGWMNSDGHRANILNCQAKAIGVGLANAGDGTIYWTQMFGSAL